MQIIYTSDGLEIQRVGRCCVGIGSILVGTVQFLSKVLNPLREVGDCLYVSCILGQVCMGL